MFGKCNTVYERWLDDDGQIVFSLVQTNGLLSLLPKDMVDKARDPETETGIHFYAYLDAKDMAWDFACEVHNPDGDDTAGDVMDMAIDLPDDLKRGIVRGIDGWCRENLGCGLLEEAGRHLEESGLMPNPDQSLRLANSLLCETMKEASDEKGNRPRPVF